MKRRIAAALLALSLLPALATAALPELSPLKARYKITVNGVPAGTAATVEVRTLGEARQEVSFEVQNRFLHHHEVSRFDWHECNATAREYRHEFRGLGIERQSSIDFDWVRQVAIESRGKERKELSLPGATYDGLNMAMLARCRLREGARALSIPVLYRSERRDMQFQVSGQEKLETPLGTFDTWVLERRYEQRLRRTRVWVAPALDWFMVRFEHVENPAARGSLVITEFSPAGTAPLIRKR